MMAYIGTAACVYPGEYEILLKTIQNVSTTLVEVIEGDQYKLKQDIAVPIKNIFLDGNTLSIPYAIDVEINVSQSLNSTSMCLFSIAGIDGTVELELCWDQSWDNTRRMVLTSQSILSKQAKFDVYLNEGWMKIALIVNDTLISAISDCATDSTTTYDAVAKDLYITPDSTFYLGNSVNKNKHFTGLVRNIKLYSHVSDIKDQICNDFSLPKSNTHDVEMEFDFTDFNDNTKSPSEIEITRGDSVLDGDEEQGAQHDKENTRGEEDSGTDTGSISSETLFDEGAKGQKGQQGFKGIKGEKGMQGECIYAVPGSSEEQKNDKCIYNCDSKELQNNKGDKGDKGGKGDAGLKGLKGEKGLQGESITGPEGLQGPPGERGERGEPGLPAPQRSEDDDVNRSRSSENLLVKGEKGEKGERGPIGYDGVKGIQGESIHGPQGPQGPPGSQGPMGPSGPAGLPGTCPGCDTLISNLSKTLIEMDSLRQRSKEQVVPGPKGEPGTVGLPGIKGENGKDGVKGNDGKKGDKGDRGDRGLKGEIGKNGAQGLRGLPGMDGKPGIPGDKGAKGDIGAEGHLGPPGLPAKLSSILDTSMDPVEFAAIKDKLKGSKGDKGDVAEKGSQGNMGPVGPAGPPGYNGRDGSRGEVGPQGPIGQKGDKGEEGRPGSITSPDTSILKGPKGDRGQPGGPGPRGPPGPRGYSGNRGPTGPKGATGKTGEKGQRGDSPNIDLIKVKGEKGDRGDRGDKGDAGKDGRPGPPGQCRELNSSTVTVGQPGPPGPPGSPGLSIIGPKGEPGFIFEDSNKIDTSNFDDEDFYVTQTVFIRTTKVLYKRTGNIRLGTLAYVLDQNILLLRVQRGWQYVNLGPRMEEYISTTAPPPISTTRKTVTEATTKSLYVPPIQPPEPIFALPSNPCVPQAPRYPYHPQSTSKKFVRMVALNEPYAGNMVSYVNLTGRSAVDNKCYQQALSAGVKGNFVAFLANNIEDLRSIVKTNEDIRVMNINGHLIFKSWSELFDGREAPMNRSYIYSFSRRNVLIDPIWPTKSIWHGSDACGSRVPHLSCRDWYSNSPHSFGAGSTIIGSKLLTQETYRCDTKLIVLCIESVPTIRHSYMFKSTNQRHSKSRKRRMHKNLNG